MATKTMQQLFVHELSDLQRGEAADKCAAEAVARRIRSGSRRGFRYASGADARPDREDRRALGIRLKRIKCTVMEGLVEEGKEIVETMAEGPVRDATLIGAGQKVEYYEVAPCGTLAAIARQRGHDEALELLLQTLEEERGADQKLARLAEGGNQRAAVAERKK